MRPEGRSGRAQGAAEGTNGASASRRARVGALVLALLAFVGVGALLFPGAGWDDAYITFWPAHTLATQGAILSYGGERLEQSSSLGFVLLLAALRRLTGVEVSILGRLAGIALGAATVVLTARAGRWLRLPGAGLAALVVGTSTPLLYWSFSGMETGLVAFAVLLMLLAWTRTLETGSRGAWLGLFAAALLYQTSRPEGYLVVLACALGLAAWPWLRLALHRPRPGPALRPLLASFAAVLLPTLVLLAFRLAYFGAAAAQPASAKFRGLSLRSLGKGLDYALDSAAGPLAVLLVLGLVGGARVLLARAPAQEATGADEAQRAGFGPVLLALCAVAQIGFAVTSGGDGMPEARFFAPAVAPLALLAAPLVTGVPGARLRGALAVLWIGAQLAGSVAFARYGSYSEPLWAVPPAAPGEPYHLFERANRDHRRYLPALQVLQRQVERAPRTPVRILSGQSGFVMYQLARANPGRIAYRDRFALTSRDFLRCSVTSGARRSEWGLVLPDAVAIAEVGRVYEACGLCPPDLVYDLFWGPFPERLREALSSSGYELLYVQEHELEGRSTWLPGARVRGRVYVARATEATPGRAACDAGS